MNEYQRMEWAGDGANHWPDEIDDLAICEHCDYEYDFVQCDGVCPRCEVNWEMEADDDD